MPTYGNNVLLVKNLNTLHQTTSKIIKHRLTLKY